MTTSNLKILANSNQKEPETIKDIVTLIQYGDYDLADNAIDRHLVDNAHNPDLNHLKGLIAYNQGHLQKAEEWIKKAIFIKPDEASYHNNIGNIFKANGALKKAEESYRRAMELNPSSPDAISNIGTIYLAADNPEYALTFFDSALAVQPGYAEAQINMSSALLKLERYQEVIELCEKLSARNIEPPIVFSNWGRALKGRGDFFEAVDLFDRAVSLYPEDPDLHNFRGVLLRLIGDFEDGWKGYQWEPYSTDAARVIYDLSIERWQGHSLTGRTLLIYGEQGIGDEIMFASCFAELIAQAESTFIACEPRLAPLFERSFPKATILAGYNLDLLKDYIRSHRIDLCCPMGDIPIYTRKQLSDFKHSCAYLTPESASVTKWRQRYAELGKGLKIGISWLGGKSPVQQRTRSIPLSHWIGLFDCTNVQFVNIQYGDHAQSLRDLKMETGVEIHDWPDINGLTEMDEFAAKVAALDLVISIDNSTVHLAASLGVETWVMLPMIPDWRWLLDRDDSPWYSSVRLFRQSIAGEWDKALQQVIAKLKEKTKAIPSYQPQPAALFVNDTSNWYHWGCTVTSSVIRRRLKEIGYEIDAIPIEKIVNMQPCLEKLEDLNSDLFFEKFSQANHELVDALMQHDLIIINGEGSLHGTSPTSVSLLYIAYVAKLRFGKNVQIVNHSCYPLGSSEWQDTVEFNLYKQVYDAIDYVAVREPVSQRLLTEGGIHSSQSFDCMPLYIERYANQIEKTDRAGVVLAGSVSWLQSSLDPISELVNYLKSQDHEVVVLIGARNNMASDDVAFVNELYEKMNANITVRVASSLREWLQILASTKLLVSGRFHHTLAAALLDTPFVLLNSNTPKLQGILELMGGDAPIAYDAPDLLKSLRVAVDKKLQGGLAAPITASQKQQLMELANVNFEAAEHYFQKLIKMDDSESLQDIDELSSAPAPVQTSPDRKLETTEHGLLLFDDDEKVVVQSLLKYGEYAIGMRELFSQLLRDGSEVVEFGSGIGVTTVEICRHVGESGSVWAENREQQEFLLLCANLALNEINNVQFFDSVSDIDLPPRCDMVVLNDTPWTPELETIVTNKLSSDRPFIMAIGDIEGIDELRKYPDYMFVEYWIDLARPDNFKGVPVEPDESQILCMVGVPS
ncbi:MAG: polysaccharide pyruvyl transferase family protein [Pseudomonadales bacterium]|nr:polysaccharide pyruvyl transferase family protein [Pseudomonadales bacterium]